MSNFLHNIAPISIVLWVCFLFLPGVASIVCQVILCIRAERKAVKFIPFYTAAFILLLVLFNVLTHLLDFVIGGFVSLLLLGSALFIVMGSGIVWILYLSLRMSMKK